MKEPEQDPLPDDDADDELREIGDLLRAEISAFAEEHDVPLGAMSPLLFYLAVTTRMSDYVLSVEQPSAFGLKLDLDRMRRELEDLVRHCKRDAEGFIAYMKEELRKAEAATENEAEFPNEGGDRTPKS